MPGPSPTSAFASPRALICVSILGAFLRFCPVAVATTSPFVPMSIFSTGGAAEFSAVADFNRDGKLDTVASNLNGSIAILLGNGNGTFQSPRIITTLTAGAHPIVTADFNRDGNPDLAVLDPVKAVVRIYLGKGDGTFGSPKTITVGNSARIMVIGDLNGDTYPDLLFNAIKGSGNTASGGFTILMNAKGGNFNAPVMITSAKGVAGGVLTAGDVNRDGHLDVVTANGSGNVEVFLGNGNGTFREQVPFDDDFPEDGETQLLLADLHGQGKLDLVIANPGGYNRDSGRIELRQGNGDGTFSEPSYLSAGFITAWVSAVDMNADGKLDLVIANAYSNSISVLINQGSGKFASTAAFAATPLLLPAFPESLSAVGLGPMSIADFNGDKKPDIVVANALGLQVLLNIGGGNFFSPTSVEIGQLPGQMIAADFNGDSHIDLALLTNGVFGEAGDADLLLGNGKGGLTPSSSEFNLPHLPFVVSLGAGYFNGSGKLGVAVSSADQILQAFNNGKGTFTAGPTLDLPNFPPYLCAGDFNRDGYSDLAVLDENEVDIYLNRRNGTYSGPVTYKLGVNPQFILTRDLNNDGKLDLVSVDNGGNGVTVLLGKGDGTFGAPKAFGAGSKPVVAIVGDFNRDSKLDLAVGNATGVAILLGKGDGTFGAAKNITAHAPVTYLAQASFRGNGIEDIVTSSADLSNNAVPENIYLLQGNGDGTFAAPLSIVAGVNPYWIVPADLNEDGASDIVVANYWTGVSLVTLLNRRGTRIQCKSSAFSVTVGHAVTFTATISASITGSGTPSGTVNFKDGTRSLGSVQLSKGAATFSTSGLAHGTHAITASYWGNTSFNPHVSSSVTVVVN
jgi:Bacterial Ig-like domain (group 3)/FG-GAP-like repeat